MKVNGQEIRDRFLGFRVLWPGTTARLAFDHGGGALLIRYDYGDTPEDERGNMACDPEALEYDESGRGRAFFKEGWRDDPETGARVWHKPFIPCHVEAVGYDAEERKQFEAREAARERQKRRLAEEAEALRTARERAALDVAYKQATVKLAEAAGAGPDKAATLTPAQHKRNVKAARAKERIDPRGVALIEREFAYVKGSAKRRGEIVAARCASGRWTHSQINETVSRKDHVEIIGRYVCDLMRRRKPQKKKRLP